MTNFRPHSVTDLAYTADMRTVAQKRAEYEQTMNYKVVRLGASGKPLKTGQGYFFYEGMAREWCDDLNQLNGPDGERFAVVPTKKKDAESDDERASGG